MSRSAEDAAGAVVVTVELTVNGKRRRARVAPLKRLLDVLREDLALPGTKEGCGEGECGACSVLMNGRSVCSCLLAAAQAHGANIVTVEGLSRNGGLSPLQQAFVELGAAQCGICTPGMLITSVELLARARGRVPDEDEVREALAGNLCRCTGYQRIVDAVRETARRTAGRTTRRTAGRSDRGAKRTGRGAKRAGRGAKRAVRRTPLGSAPAAKRAGRSAKRAGR